MIVMIIFLKIFDVVSVLFDILLTLNFILLEPRVISLCHQYKAMPACTSMLNQFEVFILISPKMIMGSSKNGRWIIPLKKFSWIRVSSLFHLSNNSCHSIKDIVVGMNFTQRELYFFWAFKSLLWCLTWNAILPSLCNMNHDERKFSLCVSFSWVAFIHRLTVVWCNKILYVKYSQTCIKGHFWLKTTL